MVTMAVKGCCQKTTMAELGGFQMATRQYYIVGCQMVTLAMFGGCQMATIAILSGCQMATMAVLGGYQMAIVA